MKLAAPIHPMTQPIPIPQRQRAPQKSLMVSLKIHVAAIPALITHVVTMCRHPDVIKPHKEDKRSIGHQIPLRHLLLT